MKFLPPVLFAVFISLALLPTAAHAQQPKFEGIVQYSFTLTPKVEWWTEADLRKVKHIPDASTYYYKNGNYRMQHGLYDAWYVASENRHYIRFKGIDTLYFAPASDSADMGYADFPNERLKVAGFDCAPLRLTQVLHTRTFFFPTSLELHKKYAGLSQEALKQQTDAIDHPFLKYTHETPIDRIDQTCTALKEQPIADSLLSLPPLPHMDMEQGSVQQAPQFKSGSFVSFINKVVDASVAANHLKIKKGQKEASQTVYVAFTVTSSGRVVYPFVVNPKEVHKKLAEEALRVVTASPAWTPAKLRGKSIPYTMYQPITFVVTE
jgi:hypothetical protein